ncbi:hypothetical protein E2C01_083384 [Portunus trituberculatus]|uniref:Uncharacterized protein n=1 Tax=Portunus trituberculatus TaxID=210409 RepID=A0A5B7J1L8_PORTR|nr:hypothetical protein [Portunus trituberculatus]
MQCLPQSSLCSSLAMITNPGVCRPALGPGNPATTPLAQLLPMLGHTSPRSAPSSEDADLEMDSYDMDMDEEEEQAAGVFHMIEQVQFRLATVVEELTQVKQMWLLQVGGARYREAGARRVAGRAPPVG